MIDIKGKIIRFLQKYWPYCILILIQILLFITNYKPGTFLVGWDNLFPELNFSLNFQRAFSAVWQEYRGMGVVDNMSHAATLIEDIERFILSFFMPIHLIRWVYIIGLHLIGALGIYHLLTTTIFNIHKKNTKIWYIVASLCAALYYQHNLGTIQQMYLPMEVFVVHFAYLPWLIWSALNVMKTGSKKDLITFSIFSLLATPQAHVPTLFIVFAMALGIVLVMSLINDIRQWKRALLIGLAVLITNAFWLFPFGYATITHSKVVAGSKAFQMASEDIYYRNNEYGDIKNIALVKSTLLEYNYFDFKNNTYHDMFWPWLEHMKTPLFQIPAWLFVIFTLTGAVATWIKYKEGRAITILLIFSVIMLGTNTPLISFVNELLREHIPLFKTVFRFVFTKFSILYAFSFSVLFAVGIAYVAEFIKDVSKKATYFTVIIAAVILYMLPSFQGYFFYDNLKVKIPDEYFKTFAFFKEQDHNTRIAMLPTPWYWAWLQPNWGTINSGFFWYAVPQPTTDLAFTPWSDVNENFYWELDRALLLKDITLVEAVLNKYDITWIYIDTNILNSQSKKLTYDSIESLLKSSSKIELAKDFESIHIFKYNSTENIKNFVGIKKDLPSLSYSQNYTDLDTYYLQNADYRKNTSKEIANSIYPYFSLFSGKAPSTENIQVKENENEIVLIGQTDLVSNNAVLYDLPKTINDKVLITNGQGEITSLNPRYALDMGTDSNGNSVTEFRINKKSTIVYDSSKDIWYRDQTNQFCDLNSQGEADFKREEKNGNVSFTLTSINTQNCLRIPLPGLSQRYGYLVRIAYKADTKRGWFMNIFNETAKKSDIETYLRNNGKNNIDYFVLTPGEMYSQGYTIYFNNKSEGVEKVINTLYQVTLYQVPYEELKNIRIENSSLLPTNNTVASIKTSSHTMPTFYELSLNNGANTNDYIYLSQSFDNGWKAYEVTSDNWFSKTFPSIFGTELKDHVKVNNWANGWRLREDSEDPKGSTIKIIFWPQYLQFAGYLLLILSLLFISFYKFLKRKTI